VNRGDVHIDSPPVEVAVARPARLGECPVWSVAEQALYRVDIDGCRVHRFDPASGVDDTRVVDGRPGAIALTSTRGRLLVAIECEVALLDFAGGRVDPWLQLEPADAGNRLNDGRTDPAGRFWVGSMSDVPGARQPTAMLHRVDADGTTTVHRRGVTVSNTLAFAPDGQTMYWSDTPTATVWAHPYDIASGRPDRPRVLVDFGGLPGRPDGACVDDTGAVWIACVGGGALVRLTPAGKVDRVIALPVASPTMPAFGGADLATLFVTSIGSATSASRPEDGPVDGALLALDVGARGVAEPVLA
jgi:L-arabinonolactonase